MNGVNVSSWDEYLQMTTKADDPNGTRLKEWDLHLQLPRDDEQGEDESLSDGAEQPMVCRLPECTTTLAVGFYNVVLCLNEIGERGWKMKERRLKTDIAKAFQHHALDVLCLSALGQLNESLDPAFEGGTKAWIEGLIADSVEPPITIYDDDHYFTIVKNTRAHITDYKIVRGFVPDQEERSLAFPCACDGDR